MTPAIRTTCPYCGVGCGVLASQKYGKVQVAGDSAHPANRGRLCSKGAALAETIPDRHSTAADAAITKTRLEIIPDTLEAGP